MNENGQDYSVVAWGERDRTAYADGDIETTYWQQELPAYQEFWHSWRTFHPNTTRYVPKK